MKTVHPLKTATTFQSTDTDVHMRLDEDSADMLLSSLTNLYSNPVRAARREYFANAHDAHLVANQTDRPIELSHYAYHDGHLCMSIRDYGFGMSVETLTKILSQYGASTKRKDNKTVGGFGLGSKSGLAVTDFFYILTVHNGVEIYAKVFKNQDNESVLRILEQKPTTALSGTTIYLPITKEQQTELNLTWETDLCGYDPDSYLVEGVRNDSTVYNRQKWLPVEDMLGPVAFFQFRSNPNDPDFVFTHTQHARPEAVKIYGTGATFVATKKEYERYITDVLSGVSVLMGGVYYPSLPSTGSIDVSSKEILDLIEEFYRNFRGAKKLVLNVPVGSVSLPPHRDTIIDTKTTWKTLLGVISRYNSLVKEAFKDHVDSLPFNEAVKFASIHPFNTVHDNSHFMWRGEKHPLRGIQMRYISNYMGKHGRWGTTRSPRVNRNLVDGSGFILMASPYVYLNGSSGPDRYSYDALASYASMAQSLLSPYAASQKQVSYRTYFVEVKMTEKMYEDVNWSSDNTDVAKSLKRFCSRYMDKFIQGKEGEDAYYTAIFSPEDLPAVYRPLLDYSVTEEEVKEYVRSLSPAKPRTTITPRHGLLTTTGVLEDYTVQDIDEVVFFGGKDSLQTPAKELNRTTQRQMNELKTLKQGFFDTKDRKSVTLPNFTELAKIVPYTSKLILVDVNRSTGKFQKDFPEATPLSQVVKTYYEDASELHRTVIQQVYKLHQNNPNLGGLKAILQPEVGNINDPVLYETFNNHRLFALGAYLAAFKEPHDPEFAKLQKTIQQDTEKSSLNYFLMLTPLTYMIEKFYTVENRHPVMRRHLAGSEQAEPKVLVEHLNLITRRY